jgi:hypothetical protein
MVCGSPLSQIAKLQGDSMQHDQAIKKIKEQLDEDLEASLGKYEQDVRDLLECDNSTKNDRFRLTLDYKVISKTVMTNKFSITRISKK